MESYFAVDAAGCPQIRRALKLIIGVCILCCACRLVANAQPKQLITSVQQGVSIDDLIEQKRFDEVVRTISMQTSRTPDDEYSFGIALASLGRLDEAREALLRGSREMPREERFYAELGGVAFKQKKYEEATAWLLKAEKLTPLDAYTNDFLGTVFYLRKNVEAALKYWNRVGKPLVENVRVDPALRVNPVVLDRAFAFSAGSIVNRADWLVTEKRLEGMGIFPRFSLELVARDDGKYDAVLHAVERNGFGSGKLEMLLSNFGGVFYQTVTPVYSNLGGAATNVSSFWRWDAEKRRVAADVSGALRRDPKWRYDLGIDLRNENWNVRDFAGSGGESLGVMNMRRSAGFARIRSLQSSRWDWSTGAEWSYRDFRSISLASGLLNEGHQLKHTAQLNYELARLPQRHYFATASASSELGRLWSGKGATFEKLQAGFTQKWAASANGDDLEFLHSLRTGKTFGDAPFDELFLLGLERDNDLPMRAHIGTRNGQKGNAPLGRQYFLSNLEFDKKVWSNGLATIKVGPFVDTGKISDPLAYMGSRKWLWDAGGQVKLRVLGMQVGVTYGRDLRAGKGAVYAWVGR